MNDKQLKRSLQSIGMRCFSKYFEDFGDDRKSNEDLIGSLMKIEGYEESGARTRVTQSRRIIREHRAIDALTIISSSERVEEWAASKARSLIVRIT